MERMMMRVGGERARILAAGFDAVEAGHAEIGW